MYYCQLSCIPNSFVSTIKDVLVLKPQCGNFSFSVFFLQALTVNKKSSIVIEILKIQYWKQCVFVNMLLMWYLHALHYNSIDLNVQYNRTQIKMLMEMRNSRLTGSE